MDDSKKLDMPKRKTMPGVGTPNWVALFKWKQELKPAVHILAV